MTDTERPRRAGPSVRVKLALSYAGLVIVAGIALFAVGFLLLRFVPDGNLTLDQGGWVPNRSDLLEVFVRYAWWAIAGLIVFGLVGGWLLAGFVLRPLDRITDAARRVQVGSLDHRIALPGRRDELTDLADAFDAMLARMDRAIAEERRFAANASHELRTPHAIIRTMVEVARADPEGRDIETVLARIAHTNDRAIDTTEALLTLARAGRTGDLSAELIDLASVAREAVDDVRRDASTVGIQIDPALDFVHVTADRALLGRLAANLLRNAVVHNVPGGLIEVSTRAAPDAGVLTVSNTGPVIDAAVAATLTEPFVRGAGRIRDVDGHDGAGLGLAIVATIVRVHGGTLEVNPRTGGGLTVRVTLAARSVR